MAGTAAREPSDEQLPRAMEKKERNQTTEAFCTARSGRRPAAGRYPRAKLAGCQRRGGGCATLLSFPLVGRGSLKHVVQSCRRGTPALPLAQARRDRIAVTTLSREVSAMNPTLTNTSTQNWYKTAMSPVEWTPHGLPVWTSKPRHHS